jgi:hypothetical protein
MVYALLRTHQKKMSMNVVKSVVVVVTLLAVSASGFYAGRKTAPKAMVVDMKTGQWVSLATKGDVHIFVASPEGYEPGVLVGHTKDGKQVLVLPPSLISGVDSPQQQSSPSQEDSTPLHKS